MFIGYTLLSCDGYFRVGVVFINHVCSSECGFVLTCACKWGLVSECKWCLQNMAFCNVWEKLWEWVIYVSDCSKFSTSFLCRHDLNEICICVCFGVLYLWLELRLHVGCSRWDCRNAGHVRWKGDSGYWEGEAVNGMLNDLNACFLAF